jgi:hypothetical protein
MEDKKLLDKIEKKIIQILKKEGGAAGLAPLKKATDNMDQPKGFNLKSVLKKMKNVEKHKNSDYILTPINEDQIRETVKQLVEELCKKGKAYRAKRMRAGEKSSAYLSGRAVKVCKGQMQGEGIEEDELNEGEFCPQCLAEVIDGLHKEHPVTEAKYKGKTVTLNKPMRGDSKKFKVYVNSGKKNADGSIKVKKVNFGHGGTSAKRPTMRIRKSNPKRRKAFRARHRCDNPGPKTMARYWSCKKW